MKSFFLLTAGIHSRLARAFADHLVDYGLEEAERMTDSDFAIALVGRGCGRITTAFLDHAQHYRRPILFVGADPATTTAFKGHLPSELILPAIPMGPEGEAACALAVLAAERRGLTQEHMHALGSALCAA